MTGPSASSSLSPSPLAGNEILGIRGVLCSLVAGGGWNLTGDCDLIGFVGEGGPCCALVGDGGLKAFFRGEVGCEAGGGGKCDNENTEVASEGARCNTLCVGAVCERAFSAGALGNGELKLVGGRACGSWKAEDGPGERRRLGGGASSKLRSRSALRGERGRENGVTVAAVVLERVGRGSARLACICEKVDCEAGGGVTLELPGALGSGGRADGHPFCCFG